MVTFKESFAHGCMRHNNRMIVNNVSGTVCKLMFEKTNSCAYIDETAIYILSTTTNPFLFTFKTI